MKKVVATALLFLAFAGSASACNILGEQLAHDEPIVKARLLVLKPGERLTAIRLCDKSVVLGGWRFIRRAKVQEPLQHIMLFRVGDSTRAVAWVEPGGKEIVVPVCPYGPRCDSLPEGAIIISGDIYTFNTIMPKGDLVILRYPPAGW
jgi:hypothetical protein